MSTIRFEIEVSQEELENNSLVKASTMPNFPAAGAFTEMLKQSGFRLDLASLYIIKPRALQLSSLFPGTIIEITTIYGGASKISKWLDGKVIHEDV